MNLTEVLAETAANGIKNIPSDQLDIMESSLNSLRSTSLSSKALQQGATLPGFNLPNSNGEQVTLDNFKTENIVVSFYRGGWCPYCNLELKALQGVLPELTNLNTSLVAISPETPDNSLTTAEKNELQFTVLSDIDNKYAKSLGLTFEMPEDLQEVYKGFDIHVEAHNGNDNYELPMPATYVINKERKIISSFISEDYKERLDPQAILEVLKK